MNKTVEGRLFPFAETGTEGVLWALQANYEGESWSYDDLYILKDGEELTIFDQDKKQVWSGIIRLHHNPLYETENIHDMPGNMDKQEWCRIFMSEKYTGKIIR